MSTVAHMQRVLAHQQRQQSANDRLHSEAQLALAELRRVRDILADEHPGEASRVNVRILALKEVLS